MEPRRAVVRSGRMSSAVQLLQELVWAGTNPQRWAYDATGPAGEHTEDCATYTCTARNPTISTTTLTVVPGSSCIWSKLLWTSSGVTVCVIICSG